MEVRGESFVKNLNIEIQKAKLKEQTDELNKQKEDSVLFSSSSMSYENDSASIDELDDIVLEEKDNNKQKYIILAFTLVLLFLITVVIIRLLSEPKKHNSFDDDLLINDIQIQEMYQAVNSSTDSTEINNNFTIKQVEQNNDKLLPKNNKVEEIKDDLFEIKKDVILTNSAPERDEPKVKNNKTTIKKEILANTSIKKSTQAKIVEEIVKKTTIPKKDLFKNINTKIKFKSISKKRTDLPTKVKGHYIQIGAFTKNPNKRLIKILNKNNYKFAFHDILIKNKKYTKFLVGSYSSRADANKQLKNIRKITKNKSAYIIRFK